MKVNFKVHSNDFFLCVCVISHLLHTKSLQSCEATGSELVPIISKSELSVPIVAPTVHLQRHEEHMSAVGAGNG